MREEQDGRRRRVVQKDILAAYVGIRLANWGRLLMSNCPVPPCRALLENAITTQE